LHKTAHPGRFYCYEPGGYKNRQSILTGMNQFQHTEIEILQRIITLLEQFKELRQDSARRETKISGTQEDYFQSIVHHALDIFMVLKVDGTITFVNTAIKSILGYSPDELKGQSIYRFLHDEDEQSVRDTLAEVSKIPGKTLPHLKLRMQTKSGSWKILEGVGKNLLQDEIVSGILLTTRDIAEREELERQLQRAQRMEALGLIAGGIAHDFRNLMAVILGAAQMLQLEHTDEEQQKYLEMITSSVNRGKTITQRILAFAQTGQPHIQTLHGLEYLENVREIAAHTLPENVNIRVKPFHGEDRIKADPAQLQQVLLGLCNNAADSMPDGGTIELAITEPTPRVAKKYNIHPKDEYLCIEVSDNGSGMDDETLNRIFEPFFTTKEEGNATGLGLSVAYSILEQHHGWIDAESEEGEGTTMVLGLPRAEPAKTNGESILLHKQFTTENRHILVVEDEAHLRELLETILGSQGYRVSIASNGKDGLLLYQGKSDEIDLIITDLKMPEMMGRELARRIHEIDPQVKIIAITGSMGLEKPTITPDDRFKAVIEKPFDVQEVLKTIRAVMNGTS